VLTIVISATLAGNLQDPWPSFNLPFQASKQTRAVGSNIDGQITLTTTVSMWRLGYSENRTSSWTGNCGSQRAA